MLHPFTIILLIANLIALVLSAMRLSFTWLRWRPLALVLIAGLQLIFDGFYQTLILVYAVTAIFIAIGFYQWKTSSQKSKTRFRAVRISWGVLWRLLFIVFMALSIVFTFSFGKSNTFFASLFLGSSADFSHLGWSEAFDEMNDHLAKDYAFGEWKALDWDSLHAHYRPQIETAEQLSDTAAYYLALRKYVFSIPDGHVGLHGNDFGQIKAAIGGGFGFAVIQLDDKRVIVHIVDENGPAKKAGMIWGAEVLTWNDQLISTALENVSLLWNASPCATREAQHIRKLNLLTRAAVGDSVTLTFRNPADKAIKEISLSAIDDSARIYKADVLMGLPGFEVTASMKPVEAKILPNGYGYLNIHMEIPSLGDLNPAGTVRKAVEEFKAANVPGVVIDVRQNFGGIDEMATMIMANFVTKPLFYEQVAMKDPKTGQLNVVGNIMLEPGSSPYTGPVAILISSLTISTGEGFPLIMKLMNRGPIVGFQGTNASFGISGADVNLPGGYVVGYPNGASQNKEGTIQLDSNHLLQGGISPDVRVPITMETMKAIFVDDKDCVLETAIAALEKNTQF